MIQNIMIIERTLFGTDKHFAYRLRCACVGVYVCVYMCVSINLFFDLIAHLLRPIQIPIPSEPICTSVCSRTCWPQLHATLPIALVQMKALGERPVIKRPNPTNVQSLFRRRPASAWWRLGWVTAGFVIKILSWFQRCKKRTPEARKYIC